MQKSKNFKFSTTGLSQRQTLFGKTTDYLILIIAITLSVLGLVVITSAVGGTDNDYVTKQIFALFLGVISAVVLSFVNYEYL